MAYKAIHTTYGLTKLAAAEATGTPINITHMAVGDGNGNPTTPSASQTGLVREMYRATVNRVYQDPTDPKLFTAELIVPASVSGFTMREVAAFDSSGGMFVVGNLPDTYKPNASEGAFADCVIRLQFYVSNASVVSIILDPAVTLATQTWIVNNITPAFLLPGGTTHQVLRKKSNADGDTEWADATDVNVVVNMVQENQTLAAGQTTVTLSAVTTNGLAVYIEGVRLRADQWTIVSATQLTLATSYPAGTKFTGVQNEPAGTLVYPLARDLNLSDVPNKATARSNLDVYNKAEADASGQPGDVKFTARNTAPTGWLKANGAAISRTAYASLFAVIGTSYGAGDGVNTFNLPDLRGEFIRCWDDGRGVDFGRAIGTWQDHQLASHNHALDRESASPGTSTIADAMGEGAMGPYPPGTGTGYTGGNETRPRNFAMLACIKY